MRDGFVGVESSYLQSILLDDDATLELEAGREFA